MDERELNSDDLEAELQRKGLNAPRLSPTLINETIIEENYYVFPGTVCTVCCLTLRNGFNVIGQSAPASPETLMRVQVGELLRMMLETKFGHQKAIC